MEEINTGIIKKIILMRVSFCKSKSSPSLLWFLPFQLMTSHAYAPTMSHDKYMRRWLTHLLPTLQIKLTSYCIVIEVSEIKKKKKRVDIANEERQRDSNSHSLLVRK